MALTCYKYCFYSNKKLKKQITHKAVSLSCIGEEHSKFCEANSRTAKCNIIRNILYIQRILIG